MVTWVPYFYTYHPAGFVDGYNNGESYPRYWNEKIELVIGIVTSWKALQPEKNK